jgi:hypothetical protein
MSADTCLLCEGRGAELRPGRLGRYARTCAACEERRGTHLSLTVDPHFSRQSARMESATRLR